MSSLVDASYLFAKWKMQSIFYCGFSSILSASKFMFSFPYLCFSIYFVGETRLGLMWTCMTLYNRPQVCFTPELQPEWLLALICIFVGCICITTAIILLASSNWDRDVIPYARWVGFTASKLRMYTVNLRILRSLF